MSDSEFRRKLGRLQSMIDIADTRLMADPKPYLEDMARRCAELLKVLDDVEYALSPDFVFDYWNEHANKKHISRPADINGEALIRCNKARDILRKYRSR